MSKLETFDPGTARVASREGDQWSLVVEKELRHSPQKVWDALTDPAQLSQWAPFDADKSLTEGATVKLATIGAPAEYVSGTQVKRADPPHILEYTWGGGDMRWQLEPSGEGTKLTLWAQIDRRYIAMGAAGWQVCLAVMDRLLEGDPVGRIVGPDAMKFEGWQHLNKEYMAQFAVEAPKW